MYIRGGRFANPWVRPPIEPGKRAAPRVRALAIVAVFACALGIRLLYAGPAIAACYGVEQERYRIAHFYHEAAASLAEGDDRVVFPRGVDPQDTLLVGYPPGYFVFMAAVYSVCSNPMGGLLIVQCVVDALTCVVLLLLGEFLFSTYIGTIAGLLMAVSPQFASLSVVLKPDTLTVLPVLLALLMFCKACEAPGIHRWIAAGLWLGLACWLRQNALLLAPALFVVAMMILPARRTALGAATMCLACLACVAPLTIRNALIYRTPIPVTMGSGFALLSGLARDDIANRYGLPRFAYNVSVDEAVERGHPEGYFFDEYDELQAGHRRKFEVKHSVLSVFAVDGIERDRARSAEAMQLIRSDPRYFARVYWVRVQRLLGYTEQNRAVPLDGPSPRHEYETASFDRALRPPGAIESVAAYVENPGRGLRRVVALVQAPFVTLVVLVLGAAGLAVCLRREWRKAVVLLAIPVYYVGLQSVMWAEFRHTLPIHASVFLFIAYGLTTAWSRFALGRRRR